VYIGGGVGGGVGGSGTHPHGFEYSSVQSKWQTQAPRLAGLSVHLLIPPGHFAASATATQVKSFQQNALLLS
jgi:hypothetical protein